MSQSAPIINTKYGKLSGQVLPSFENYHYCSYKGVPYAKPPVGDLRFKDPQPPERWDGIKEANTFGPPSGQYDPIQKIVDGDDDCLYLNVYVKSADPNAKLPVMLWIHGGGFVFGSGDDFLYGPDYLLKKDIVLVTINYRLGVLGFLNFDDEVAPGNQGLKDQIMALKWLQENVRNFGGDPNNVTIFGESAGAASVHFLAMSDLAKGLFHKAISQSGSACNTWSCTSRKENAYKICEILGKQSDDPKELVEFLRTVDCKRLVQAQQELMSLGDKFRYQFPFGPGIDSKSKQPVIPIDPLEAFKNGVDVPFIIGYNSAEGIFGLPGIKEKEYNFFRENFEECLNPVTIDMLRRNRMNAEDLKKFYYRGTSISEENQDRFVNFQSEINFVHGVHRTLEFQAKNNRSPTYHYRFTYDEGYSMTKMIAKTDMKGASHFDEVHYLFSMRLCDLFGIPQPKVGSPQYKVIDTIRQLWYNFAKYGNPTHYQSDIVNVKWAPINNEKYFRTLNIGEGLRMETTIHMEERIFFGKRPRNKL